MKKLTYILAFILVFTGLFVSLQPQTITAQDEPTVVYFYSPACLGCASLIGGGVYDQDGINGEYDTSVSGYNPDNDYLKQIKDAGITIIYINVDITGPSYVIPPNVVFEDETPTIGDLQLRFSERYDVPKDERYTPLMFAGDAYYYDSQIISNIDELISNASDPLLEVDVEAGENYARIQGFFGFLGVLGAGFLDGFNPCAIALLLMFISLVGFTENKRVLIAVSITYIGTMFLTYFLIGLGILSVLESFSKQSGLATIVTWFIFILVIIFFIFNLYDYFVSKNEDYGKIKNQLPKWIQRMNKRIVKTFTSAVNEEGKKGNLTAVILLTFVLGVLLSLTEFLCTGQIYLGILDGVRVYQTFYGYFALFMYNVMFVLPMIVIAVFAIKNESIVGVSNWIREHLHVIKLLNALLFLGIAIYYGFRLFG